MKSIIAALCLTFGFDASAEDLVRVDLEKITREMDRGLRAVQKEDYAGAVKDLAFPARAGYKQAQYLYGVSLARTGAADVIESLAWIQLSLEGGHARWSDQADPILAALTSDQLGAVEARAQELARSHGADALNMRCITEKQPNSHMKFTWCEHRLRASQDFLELPREIVPEDY